jgi:hypothetical protein
METSAGVDDVHALTPDIPEKLNNTPDCPEMVAAPEHQVAFVDDHIRYAFCPTVILTGSDQSEMPGVGVGVGVIVAVTVGVAVGVEVGVAVGVGVNVGVGVGV